MNLSFNLMTASSFEILFSKNGIALFFIACIAVVSYTNFKENQRMFLLYLFSYSVAAFSVFRIRTCLLLFLISTFFYLEYLTDDSLKTAYIIKIRFKLYDYLYLILFQYEAAAYVLSLLMLHFHKQGNGPYWRYACMACSLSLLIYTLHHAISQPFKVKSFAETIKVFDRFPLYEFSFEEALEPRLEMLCDFEDKSFFKREKSYSCFSWEYFRYKRSEWTFGVLLQHIPSLLPSVTLQRGKVYFRGRGFSTPEMQLIRTIGIERGYDQYKVRRKFYEIIYSKIIFNSLRDYHQDNTHYEIVHYRHYILWVYLQTVLTRIKGNPYQPLSKAFETSNIKNWSMEGLFIACLGLSFKSVTERTIACYWDVIEKYGLEEAKIWRLYEEFPGKKLPGEAVTEAEERL